MKLIQIVPNSGLVLRQNITFRVRDLRDHGRRPNCIFLKNDKRLYFKSLHITSVAQQEKRYNIQLESNIDSSM